MKYNKVGGYILAKEDVPAQGAKTTEKVNNIWIYDRSGSMTWVLDRLAEDLVVHSSHIKDGDTLTLGWFSGVGHFNWLIKGVEVNAKSLSTIASIIRANKSSLNTTCFSEIFGSSEQVINDLVPFSKVFSLMFFTDGYPVVPDYNSELNDLYRAINAIKGKLSYSMLVGYGDYYNKSLMSDIAKRLGSTLIHSSSLQEFSDNMDVYTRKTNTVEPPVLMKAPYEEPELAFAIYNGRVMRLNIEKGVVFVPKDLMEVYYVFEKKYDTMPFEKSVSMLPGLVGAAYLYTQNMETDVALEFLKVVGDVDLIDAVNNAWTNEEYGRAESRMLEFINTPSARYNRGKSTNYLPKRNAFCLVDLLNQLSADKSAYFFPYDPRFVYKRIGQATKTKEGYPKFYQNLNSKCPVSDFVWHESRMNLSLRCKIDGHVELPANSFGFSEMYPTYIWRNYALVKDRVVNTRDIPVSMSEDTYLDLKLKGIVDEPFESGKPILVHIWKLPIVNRAMMDKDTTARELCQWLISEYETQGILKALNYFKKELEQSEEKKDEVLSKEQLEWLESVGIGKNGFNPPVDKIPAVDWYYAKEFTVSAKGLSSFPSVKDTQNKLESNGKLTLGEYLVSKGIVAYKSSIPDGVSNQSKLVAVTDLIKQYNKVLRQVRMEIQETKFKILLSKKWFSDLSKREGAEVEIGDYKFTFNFKTTTVEY